LPSETSIIDGSYHVARLVVAYVKTEKYNIVPGLREFTMEMTSPQAAAEGGYMTQLGLVPLPQTELRESGAAARALEAGR
jgi:phosphate transport system substrate-binding protein